MVAGVDHVMRGRNDLGVRRMGDPQVLAGIVQRRQEMQHAVQPGAFLVVGLDDGPGRIGGVGVEEHRLLGFGVIIPFPE